MDVADLSEIQDEDLDAIDVDIARRDPAAFAQYVLRDEMTGAPVDVVEHQQEWHELMSRHDRLVIRAAVGLGKSQHVSIARVLWEIGHNPNLRVVILSASQALAQKLARSLRRYIEGSEELHKVFPDLRRGDIWNELSFNVKRSTFAKDPTVQVLGVGSKVYGSRIDLLVIDDVLDLENTATPHLRKKTIAWIMGMPMSRTPLTRVWAIGTPFHRDDFLAHLQSLISFKGGVYNYPVLVMRDGQLISRWPHGWPMHKIEAFKDEHGPLEYARQLLVEARDDETARFKRDWIVKAKALGDGMRPTHNLVSLPYGYNTYTGVDLGTKRKNNAKTDRTALTTIIVHPNAKREILWVESGRWTGPEILQRITQTQQRYMSTVVVEDNAAQQFIIDFAVGAGLNTIGMTTTGKNKRDPVYGVEGLAVELARGDWIIPSVGGRSSAEIEALCGEMEWYDPTSHTGDRLMACVTPGALVTARRGLIPIEDVVTGDEVLTHRARWRRVTGIASRHYEGDVVRVKPSGMHPLMLTTEHPVWSANAKPDYTVRGAPRLMAIDWDWRAAADLKAGRKSAGQYVLAPRTPEGLTASIDLAQFVPETTAKHGGKWKIGADKMDWRSETSFARHLEITDEVAFFVGLYLAEGWTNSHQAMLGLHEDEAELQAVVARMASRFDAGFAIDRRRGSRGVSARFDSVIATRWLKCLGGHAHTKCLTPEMMAWPVERRLAVLRGWLAGDGNNHNGVISGVSTSKHLIAQLQTTAFDAGFGCSVNQFAHAGPTLFAGKPSTGRDSWHLSLARSDAARLFQVAGALEIEHWRRKRWTMPTEIRERTNSRSAKHADGMAIRLGSLDRGPYVGMVHNLHVDEDESFVVGGIAVHNCWIAKEAIRLTVKPKVHGEVGRLNLMVR